VDYDVRQSKSINYLIDYSTFLIKNKLFDEKILNWQVENSSLLKPLGLDFQFLKKKLEETNKNYYKYEVLMNQISCK
jgi:hypothetical protein